MNNLSIKGLYPGNFIYTTNCRILVCYIPIYIPIIDGNIYIYIQFDNLYPMTSPCCGKSHKYFRQTSSRHSTGAAKEGPGPAEPIIMLHCIIEKNTIWLFNIAMEKHPF